MSDVLKMSSNLNPSVDWFSIFCSGCGGIMDEIHTDKCILPIGRFCSQCGQPKHNYVCYPDARNLEKFGLKASSPLPSIHKKSTRPLW